MDWAWREDGQGIQVFYVITDGYPRLDFLRDATARRLKFTFQSWIYHIMDCSWPGEHESGASGVLLALGWRRMASNPSSPLICAFSFSVRFVPK
jgi:hypothetical protein